MIHKKFALAIILFFLMIILQSCNKSAQAPPQKEFPGKDDLYDSEFPSKPVSEELEKIIETVKLLSTFSVYNVYSYDEGTPSFLINKDYERHAYQTYVEEKPANGTATVIYNQNGLIGMLTCAHIIDTPDTLIKYFDDKEQMIKSIHVLERQNRMIVGMDEFQDFKIFIIDKEKDIALIGKKIPIEKSLKIPVFPFKPGNAEDLGWGTFTYLFGYPKGKKMLSSAIVSNPHRNKGTSFVIDASLPRGISGGVVLALRNGPPNFELVGMVNAVSADIAKVLVPDRRINPKNDRPGRPYTGKIYAKTVPRISYGIEYAITINTILEFIKMNKKELESFGFDMNGFFKTNSNRKNH
jgi:hypothetical protein